MCSSSSSPATEELRRECEMGLKRARYLMALMVCVTCAIAPTVAVCDWIIVEARRGNLEKDWWKCLVYQDALSRWIVSSTRYELPAVLSALLYQSCILAWASVVVYQRSCIRMDWISSCIVNNAFTLLLMLLPPLSVQWATPSAITSSLVTLWAYVERDSSVGGRGVPEPNQCGKAQWFARLCLFLVGCCALVNGLCLTLAIRAEMIRRRVDKKAKMDEEDPEDGLDHRLCCKNNSAPREIVFGSLAFATYVICAASRATILVVCQRSFMVLTRERSVGSISLGGGTTLVAADPSIAIGPSLAMLAFAQILRGFSADDLASYRVAAFLSSGALIVDAPGLTALIHGIVQHKLYNFDLEQCVSNYIFGDTGDLYGFPTKRQARIVCRCVFVDFYSASAHVFFVAAMCVATVRIFTLNHHTLDNVVTPAPGDRPSSMRILHASDGVGFEYDLLHRPTIEDNNEIDEMKEDKGFSAVIIRPTSNTRRSSSSTDSTSRRSRTHQRRHHFPPAERGEEDEEEKSPSPSSASTTKETMMSAAPLLDTPR